MISYNEAKEIIHKKFKLLKPDTEIISLHESLHRTLAEDIFTDTDFPAFDHSAMDGFAVNISDDRTFWTISDEISAGNFHKVNLDTDTAVSIMTGAKIPSNANAVIQVENVIKDGKKISLRDNINIKVGMNIRRKGEDCKINTKVISSGTQITAAHIPLLTGCGKDRVKVLKKLTIGILATGDELIEFSSIQIKDMIRATNGETLLEQVKQTHQIPEMFGVIKDSKEVIEEKLNNIFSQENCPDILITTGGVSVGDRDYIPEVLDDLGVDIHFRKVNIKPGKPLLFGTYEIIDKTIFIFGLPGNPVSAFVNFRIFVQPAIEQLYDQNKIDVIVAEVSDDIKKTDKKRNFIRGNISYNKDLRKYFAEPIENQSSGNMFGLSKANCLIVIPEIQINLSKGSSVECILI